MTISFVPNSALMAIATEPAIDWQVLLELSGGPLCRTPDLVCSARALPRMLYGISHSIQSPECRPALAVEPTLDSEQPSTLGILRWNLRCVVLGGLRWNFYVETHFWQRFQCKSASLR